MSPAQIKLIANVISVILSPLAEAAWAFLKVKLKIGKNNTKVETGLQELKEAVRNLDDDTPITEEQKQRVIDAARDFIYDV